jgi:hypothetical protein
MQDGFTKASLCFSRLLDFQATICFSTSEPKYYLSGPHRKLRQLTYRSTSECGFAGGVSHY